MVALYRLMGVNEDDFHQSHRFVTSWALPPLVLGLWRALIAIYVFTTIIFIFIWQGTRGESDQGIDSGNDDEFSYFTSLSFWGLAFYFLVAAVHTTWYARTGVAPIDRWPRPLQALHSLLYTTVITFPILVTVVYWALLNDGSWDRSAFLVWTNISRHVLNGVFAVAEIVLPATSPPPWLHLPFLILILALYLAVAYITSATQEYYPYNFLDPDTGSGRVAAYTFGILAAGVVVFVVVWLLIWLRRRFTPPGRKTQPKNIAY